METITLHNHHLFERYAETHGITKEEATHFFRETYQVEREEEIYAQLPPPPPYFFIDANRLFAGNAGELEQIGEETYLQPEFYPTFQSNGVNRWIETPRTRPQTYGIASLPAEQNAVVDRNQGEVETTLFISSAWGATIPQAIGFRYEVNPPAPIGVEFEPRGVILGPNFPVFSKDWSQKINIKMEIGENIEAGTYVITVFTGNPPEDKTKEWDRGNDHYLNANTGIGLTNGIATFTIEVVEK